MTNWWNGGKVETVPRILKDGIVERWNGGMVEWWNGGMVEWWNGGMVEWWKTPHIVIDRIAERRNSEKNTQILKDGKTENQPKS